MSAPRTLPRDLPRSGRFAYFAARLLVDDVEPTRWRTIPGGIASLTKLLGHDAGSSTRRAVMACIKHGVMERIGDINHPRSMILVDTAVQMDGASAKTREFCRACGESAEQRLCPLCKQGPLGRSDRSWQSIATQMVIHQVATSKRVDVLSIHMRTNAPLWRELDVNGLPVQGGGSAIVPFVLRVHGDIIPATQRKELSAALVEAIGADPHRPMQIRGSHRQRGYARRQTA